MPDYNEFRAKTIGLFGKKHFKISNSYGTKQAWRWLRKNKWLDIGQPITEHDFGAIIKAVNLALKDRLFKGHDIHLPERMGKIEIRKYSTKIRIKDGKMRTNLPVNWSRTLKLWYSDEEAKKSKFLVRQEPKQLFTIYYNKSIANYNNQAFYQFTPNRTFKKELSDKVNNDEIDAFLISKYELYECKANNG